MPSHEAALATLVDELRTVGVGVSVGEHLDAARALASIPLADLEVVRSSLQCALVKRSEHLDAFNVLFNLYFRERGRPTPGPSPACPPRISPPRSARPSLPATRRLSGNWPRVVRRYAALEPGAPVAGVFAMIAASEAADLDGIKADLLAAMGQADGGGAGSGGWRRGRWRRGWRRRGFGRWLEHPRFRGHRRSPQARRGRPGSRTGSGRTAASAGPWSLTGALAR